MILFLDIDGVLNSNIYFRSEDFIRRSAEIGKPNCQFDPLLVENMNEVLREIDPKVVLSSNWRWTYNTPEKAQEMLRNAGLEANVIDVTPILAYDEHRYTRAGEIQLYVDRNEVRSYYIIDDNPYMFSSQNVFRTDPELGFKDYYVNIVKRDMKEIN